MAPHRTGILILFATVAAIVIAVWLQWNACLVAALVMLVGLALVVVLVTRNAQQRLAASRAALMREAQMCPACGYTIRAKTDRCPECGTPVK